MKWHPEQHPLPFFRFHCCDELEVFKEDGLGGVYNEDGSEAMDWDEVVDNPHRTQTLTSLQQWQSHQLVLEPEAHNPARVDVVIGRAGNQHRTFKQKPTTYIEVTTGNGLQFRVRAQALGLSSPVSAV